MPFPARVATSVALSLTAVVVVAAAAGNRTHARSDAPGPRVLYTVPDARLRFTRDADFVGWAAAHGRVYASTAERAAAEDTWRTNRAWALAMNAQNERRRVDDDDRGVSAHVLSVDGPFADMTHEAFVATVVGTSLKTFRLSAPSRNDGDGGARARGWERGEPPPPSPSPLSPPPSPLPPVVDWVSEGVVAGPVADQGKCGSCWAISAVEAMEAVFKQRTGTFKRGSVQQILDCDREASGCAGGAFDSAYEWVEANGGMTTADDYPYRERRGECELRGEDGHPHRKVINIDGHGKVPPGEAHLLRRVATQPVAAALEANREVQLYHSGVLRPFDPDCGAGVNHAVLVVGYDVRGGGKESVNESPYVKVKNSWGKRWGEDGFARLALTGDDTRGACGVATSATFPTRDGEAAPVLPPTPPGAPPRPSEPPPVPFLPPRECPFRSRVGGVNASDERGEVSAWRADCCILDVAIGDGAPCVTWHATLYAVALMSLGAAAATAGSRRFCGGARRAKAGGESGEDEEAATRSGTGGGLDAPLLSTREDPGESETDDEA